MATTYTLISSNVLTGSAASVTFSSIPSTYTDLVLKMSVRSDSAGNFPVRAQIVFNSDTATNYSNIQLVGYSGSASSYSNASLTYLNAQDSVNGAGSTSNTFSNTEIYIPNYTVAQNKAIAQSFAAENNSVTIAFIGCYAELWRNTATINQIVISPNSGTFASGSSFYLYGIKNS